MSHCRDVQHVSRPGLTDPGPMQVIAGAVDEQHNCGFAFFLDQVCSAAACH